MKKDNYKIKFNQEMPSSSDIKKHQDFDALMADYKQGNDASPGPHPKRKVRKIWKRVAVAAAAAIGLLIIAVAGFKKGKSHNTVANNSDAPYVNPPLKNTVPEEILTAQVDGNQGGRIVFKSGTVAVVPPRAFANRAGEVVGGEVEVKIKEYHDYIDFFLSGIPMDYDSLGVKYQLESAGMIEIYAEQDGHRLDLLPEKSIDIELKSSVQVRPGDKEPNFNIYELDQEARNWKYITQDKMEFIGEEQSISSSGEDSHASDGTVSVETLTRQLESLDQATAIELKSFEKSLPLPVQPTKPEKANTDNPTFELKVDKMIVQDNISAEEKAIQMADSELRELRRLHSKTIWEVMPDQAAWPYARSTTDWVNHDIKSNGNGLFTVIFMKEGSSAEIVVKPVLLGKNYQEAIEKFNQEFADYSKVAADRQALIDVKKAELEEIKKTKKMGYKDRIAALKAQGQDKLASNEMVKREVLNKFNVTSFGIWNCDRPLPIYASSLKGKFSDQHNVEYQGLEAFRADKSRNTVAKFVAMDGIDVQYNTKSDNLMWFVTDDNKIAVYRPQAFKKIKKKRGEFNFVMDLEEKEVNSEEDIREILNFD